MVIFCSLFCVLFFQTHTSDLNAISSRVSAFSLLKKQDQLAEHPVAILINIDHELEKIIQVIKTNSDEKTLEEAKFRLRILYRKHSEHHALQAIIYPYNALFVLKLDLPPCIDGDKVQQETKARVIPITVVQKVESDKSKVIMIHNKKYYDQLIMEKGLNSSEPEKAPIKPKAPWNVNSFQTIENGYQVIIGQGYSSADSLAYGKPVQVTQASDVYSAQEIKHADQEREQGCSSAESFVDDKSIKRVESAYFFQEIKHADQEREQGCGSAYSFVDDKPIKRVESAYFFQEIKNDDQAIAKTPVVIHSVTQWTCVVS